LSFRTRLALFFVMLVIVPVLALALVGILIVRGAQDGRDETRLAQGQRAAEGLYQESRSRSEAVARTIAGDQQVAGALRDGDDEALTTRLEDLAGRSAAVRLRLTPAGGQPIEVGGGPTVAPARAPLVDGDGEKAGEMVVSVTGADDYATLLSRITGGLEVLVTQGDSLLGGTLEGSPRGLPLRGEAELAGTGYRITGFEAPGFDGDPVAVRVLVPSSSGDGLTEGSLGITVLLLAFMACAIIFAATAILSLKSVTNRLLNAAQELGQGNFGVKVPTEGNDEFAGLGAEFNSMAGQLEARLHELQLERSRLQEVLRRVGDTAGKGLDLPALLAAVLESLRDGAGADCGRVRLYDVPEPRGRSAAQIGNLANFEQVMKAAESAARAAEEEAETQMGDLYALARPLHASDSADGLLGVIAIARPGRRFSDADKDLFSHLANQAALSVENNDLHEAVQRQAVTDELTGLFNHRRFQEVITMEAERTKRFDHELGLIMLDIDNFKRVNDTYGHLQGDQVLREVARVLRDSSREVDEPARYGGEEMAVALPQTGLQGAYDFAERVRQRIERLELPLVEGEGTLKVTASFGVASMNRAGDKDSLVGAADAALYRAKRAGKNRTEKAE